MKAFLISGLLIANFILNCQALQCWVCTNEGSNEACILKGKVQRCLANEGACQNEMRRNDGRLQITKRCKQILACDNNFVQNERAAWFPTQCNIDAPTTHCKCCCNFEGCNKRNLQCLENIQCPPISAPANGGMTCTRGGSVDSVCEFTCNEGFGLVGSYGTECEELETSSIRGRWTHPPPRCVILTPQCEDLISSRASYECTNGFQIGSTCYVTCLSGSIYPPVSNNITCGDPLIPPHLQPRPKWSVPPEKWNVTQPCCVESCPPHAHMDACIVLDSTSSVGSENWMIMKKFAVRIIEAFNVDSGGTRFSVFKFGTFPSSKSQIRFIDHARDRKGLVKSVMNLEYTNAGSTFIGRALRHAQIMFQPNNGDRPSVPNVLFVITDGKSYDGVKVVSEELRARGVKTFVIGVTPADGSPDDEQLLQIAGSPLRKFTTKSGFVDLSRKIFADEITIEICGNPCETIHCHPGHQNPLHGRVTCTNGDLVNSTCSFVCDDDRMIHGSQTSKCEDDGDGDTEGRWSHEAPTCKPIGPPCKELVVTGGSSKCSDGFKLGSKCDVTCPTGVPYPGNVVCNTSQFNESEWDLTQLRWNITKPCCAAACPPTASVDIAIVLDGSYSIQPQNWQRMIHFTTELIMQFTMDNDDARFSVFSFGIEPDDSSAILLDDFIADREGLLEAVSLIPYLAADGTYIGRALEFARDVVFRRQHGERPGVKNMLIVITDGYSTDPVLEVSNDLRRMGVQTFAVGMTSPFGRLFNTAQLLEIAGGEGRLITPRAGFQALTQTAFLGAITLEVCGNPCNETKCHEVFTVSDHGRYSCTMGNSLHSRCSFGCDEGYVIHGERDLICMSDFDDDRSGVWSSPTPTCVEPENPCEDLVVHNGAFKCSDNFNFGSKCDILCASGEPYPPLEGGKLCCGNRSDPKLHPEWMVPENKWGIEEPCCRQRCPPYAHMDACIILDSSYSVKEENWQKMKTFAKSIISSFELSHDIARFAVFSYGMFTDDVTEIKFGDYVRNKSGLLDAIDTMQWMEADGTFTGRALRHANDVIFQSRNGERPHVDNLVIVVTDGQSCDKVEGISQEMRSKGIKTFAVGVHPPRGRSFNRSQLLSIAGDESRLFIPKLGFQDLDAEYFHQYMGEEICGNPCDQVVCRPIHVAPSNGHVECTRGHFLSSVCTFTCNSGYKVKGNSSSTCVEDLDGDLEGRWSSRAPQCEPLVPPCDAIVIIRGEMNCTDEFNLGSTCTISCEGGRVFPSYSETVVCRNSSLDEEEEEEKILDEEKEKKIAPPAWDVPRKKCEKLEPCCYESCPPRDVTFVLDSSSSVRIKNWQLMKDFVVSIIQASDMDNDQARFSVMSYGMFYDENSQILFNQFVGDKQGLISAVQSLEWLESDGTGTGMAMRRAKDVLFKTQNGARNNAGDVLVVVTDGVSCDGVEEISQELRAQGVETYAFGVHPPKGPSLNETQLLLIAGSRDRMFIPEAGFENLGSYVVTMSEEICGNPCKEVFCSATPAPPRDGNVVCGNGNALHSACVFTCDPGFKVDGGSVSVCQDDYDCDTEGVWSIEPPKCIPFGGICVPLNLTNGEVRCSDGFNLGSECELMCRRGEVFPAYPANKTRCGDPNLPRSQQTSPKWGIPANKWNVMKPCCAESCPPRAFMDACFVLDSTFSVGSENWQIMVNFTKRVISLFEMSQDEARFAVFNYGVHTSQISQVLLNQHAGDQDALIRALDDFQWLKADGTNTSHALRHARDVIFKPANGDRAGVSNVLVVITDGRSDDSVDEVARSLRADGVKTFALGVHPPTARTPLNRTELLVIAGSEERLILPDEGFVSLSGQEFAARIGSEICGNPCENIECPRIKFPENGVAVCDRGNSLNSQCAFSCEGGYYLVGDFSSTCINDFDGDGIGKWTSKEPRCELPDDSNVPSFLNEFGSGEYPNIP